jgi:hypothetical protein
VGKLKTDLEPTRHKSKNNNRCDRGLRFYVRNLGIALAISTCLISCTTLKEAAVVSTGAATGAVVGTVISGGAAAPILGATTGAFVVDAATGLITSSGKTQTIIKAPDNVFTLAHKITELAGWSLILIFVLPMVFGWIFPSPFETKKRKRR